jgi:hypothetical protein
MDDEEAKTYSTPPQAAPTRRETRAATERMAKGLPTLFASVFAAFLVVALVILAIRYLF